MENKVTKKIKILKDKNNKLINDIDTDQIFHNKYLSIVDIEKMGQYSLDNLEGYENFSQIVEKDMILIAGENFGSGSSRQQAVDCFRALKLFGIAGKSFGAIYKRNVINSGFPLIEIIEINEEQLKTGIELIFNFETGEILTKNNEFFGKMKKMSSVQKEIIEKGSLLKTV